MTLKEFKKLNRKQLREYGESLSKDFTFNKHGSTLIGRDNSNDYWQESTYDENNNVLTFWNDSGFWQEFTYDKNGNRLTFRNSHGDYRVKNKDVSKKEYNKFIKEQK